MKLDLKKTFVKKMVKVILTISLWCLTIWNTLNLLIGNYDYRGGFIAKTDYNSKGDKPGQAFDISKHPQKAPNFGIPIIRSGTKYEDTTLFSGYPAKRNFRIC